MVTDMIWALIDNGRVVELTSEDPAGRFHESLNWVACSDEVQIGWLYSSGVFSAAPAVVLSAADVCASRLQAYRVESDPLKLEADYDSLQYGVPPDYSAWMAKVAEIKERFPLPT